MTNLRLPSKRAVWVTVALVLGLTAAIAACSSAAPTATPAPTRAQPTATSVPAPTATAEPVATLECPNSEAWASSAHADATAAAFTHWDTADPAEVPVTCAKCHSTPGFLDWLGADGTTQFKVDNPAPVGTVINCTACHNDVANTLSVAIFPSGVEIDNLGPEARCMQCHQGRASANSVNDAITKAALASEDTVSDQLAFVNIHYSFAAASLYGGEVHGGYEYEGKSYDIKFAHVENLDTCVQCHDSHSLEVDYATCSTCHGTIASAEDLKNIRMKGSEVDYNGNGNITEGIYYEVQGVQQDLLAAMQKYAKDVAKAPIAYDANTYPYFFNDKNGNGVVDPDEANSDNQYKSWTPRLLKAGYNYQFSVKDAGVFVHNAKYVVQIMYDSIEDLDPAAVGTLTRDDVGHFDGAAAAWRHWDTEEAVPGTCAKCHSAAGLPLYLAEGVNISEPQSNGLACSTCHNDVTTFTRYDDPEVTFPSGAVLSFENSDANLCLNCHQGRESTVSMDSRLAGLPLDDVSSKLRFVNPHYFGAGANLFGGEAEGAYQYAEQAYVGRNTHVTGFDTCIQCHDTHALSVNVAACGGCHQGVKTEADLRNIRLGSPDYDGDGNVTEGIADDISTLDEDLYTAIQTYAKEVVGKPIVYSGDSYPYFFNDTNGNGQLDPDEATSSNGFSSWTPRLLRVAYNHQWVNKDPGAFAHNGKYIVQILYDSLSDLGQKVTVDMTGMIRP